MRRTRKLRRLPLPLSWSQPPVVPTVAPTPARHWLDRHEAERDAQDERLTAFLDQPLAERDH